MPGTTRDVHQAGRGQAVGRVRAGKEAVVGLLKSGDFLGEGCLAGQSRRMATATALTPTTILILDKQEMTERLHDNVRVLGSLPVPHALEEHPHRRGPRRSAVQLEREAAGPGAAAAGAVRRAASKPQRVLPKLSQELLAEMVGTTRSRVNFFMNKFRKLGFIEYNGGLKIDSSLLSVVLHD